MIEVIESGRCAGACRHCHATSELIKKTATNNWQITFAQKIAIQRLLKETDFSPKNTWIHIWNTERVDHLSVDFGETNKTFSGVTFSISSTWTQGIINQAQINMQWILWRLEAVDNVTIWLTREQAQLWQQHNNLWIIIRTGLDMLSGKVQNVTIRGWSNDVSQKKFSNTKTDVEDLHDWLRAVRQENSLTQLGRSYGAEIAKIILQFPRDTIWMSTGQREEDWTFSIETRFKFGDKQLTIRHDLLDNPTLWKLSTLQWIIETLKLEGTEHVLFAGNEVNLFHSTDSTNMPWVWVQLSHYQKIINRASKIWYNQALIEHFSGLSTT